MIAASLSMIPDQSNYCRDGFLQRNNFVPHEWCREFLQTLSPHPEGRAGLRDLFGRVPQLRNMIASPDMRDLIAELLSPQAFAVRAILFDKTSSANWFVTWHQDTTIAVRERVETTGYGPWSVKEGIVHVRPPREILERMVTLRIHLDDCGPENGPLEVIPGSHTHGMLAQEAIGESVATEMPEQCIAKAGDCIALSPLLLHASRKAQQAAHRRVLHLESADCELPDPLEWYERHGTDRIQ